MPAYQYKTQEGKDKHNAWRREYYRKNKERIRVRDNANARKRRRENKELGITPKKYTRKKIDVRNNPDKERIREAIHAEIVCASHTKLMLEERRRGLHPLLYGNGFPRPLNALCPMKLERLSK